MHTSLFPILRHQPQSYQPMFLPYRAVLQVYNVNRQSTKKG